jgi:hypothetical protein
MLLTFGDARHRSFASSAAYIAARNFWNWVASLAALERGFEQVFVDRRRKAAPPSIQTFNCATVLGQERGGSVRPSPGL